MTTACTTHDQYTLLDHHLPHSVYVSPPTRSVESRFWIRSSQPELEAVLKNMVAIVKKYTAGYRCMDKRNDVSQRIRDRLPVHVASKQYAHVPTTAVREWIGVSRLMRFLQVHNQAYEINSAHAAGAEAGVLISATNYHALYSHGSPFRAWPAYTRLYCNTRQ